MAFTLSPSAHADLDGIRDHTAERWDADQADRYIRQLAQAFTAPPDGSIPGRAVNDTREGCFKLPVGLHVVVIRVPHQRMDVTRQLGRPAGWLSR